MWLEQKKNKKLLKKNSGKKKQENSFVLKMDLTPYLIQVFMVKYE